MVYSNFQEMEQWLELLLGSAPLPGGPAAAHLRSKLTQRLD
jgi:hypothetical protein